jgi:hypothetical protein
MPRSTSKEAVRLWFEFLKRAHQTPSVKVNSKFYKAWGDVAGTKFEAWWREVGCELFPLHKVTIAERYLSNSEVLMVSVPKSLTPTAAGNQLRELLLEHYQATKHKPTTTKTFAFTAGAEIKVSSFRTYLATWDANAKLETQLSTQRVPAKLVLAEVREVYRAKVARWQHTKRKVQGLPSTLIETETDTEAERAVRRYLKVARKLVAAAAAGDFPSKDYNKVS